MDPVRDELLRSLSNYSECIRPYLRQIQEKYSAAYYVSESGTVDLNAYCRLEKKQALAAQKKVEESMS